jgi:hypothetical protein
MNIIFDSKVAEQLKDKYTVLELDTIMQPGLANPVTIHAIIDQVDLTNITQLPGLKSKHEEMVNAYKSGDWSNAIILAESLKGIWQGELDDFYQEVIDFSRESAILNKQWDGVRHTIPKE